MTNGILIFAEQRAGAFGKTTFEAIAAGEQVGAGVGQARGGESAARVQSMRVETGAGGINPKPPFQEVKQAVDLTKADVIVAVGRGIKSQENLALAQQLADALGAELAASRP